MSGLEVFDEWDLEWVELEEADDPVSVDDDVSGLDPAGTSRAD